MKLKSLLIGSLAVLLVGVGVTWRVGSLGGKWAWSIASISTYVPDPKDINFYYPLPEVVEMTSPFGYRTHPIHGDRRLHAGMDLGAPEGMPVLSAHSGYVRYADWGDGYGKMVIVEYADGKYQTLYAHLSEILVSDGEAVRPRQVIGKVGSTGGVTGPHLHFELLRKQDGDFVAIDPAPQVKAVEAFVAIRPPESSPAAPTTVASQPPWQAPALDARSPAPVAAVPSTAIAPPDPPINRDIILNFDP